MIGIDKIPNQRVALRKESVDRNLSCNYPLKLFEWSLSARRAWIEIARLDSVKILPQVALRKESVDRNKCYMHSVAQPHASLSARRAWIEMLGSSIAIRAYPRSLSARRAWIEIWVRSVRFFP